VATLWNAFSQTLSRYLGGLVLATTIEGTLAGIALHFLGVPYAFLFGAWVALTAFIPYVGAWIGYAPAVLYALSISISRALVTVLVCVLINGFVGNVITPRIHGRTVHVPPLLVFLAVVAGGELFGFPGIVLAVPAVAMLRVLIEFFQARLRVVDESSSSGQPIRVSGADGRHDRGVRVVES
jgi:predicted PurR-regulated permease PerM